MEGRTLWSVLGLASGAAALSGGYIGYEIKATDRISRVETTVQYHDRSLEEQQDSLKAIGGKLEILPLVQEQVKRILEEVRKK